MGNIDFSYLIAVSEGDEEFIQQFIETFENNSLRIVERMKDCFNREDWVELKKCAHQLKPSFEMLKLSEVGTVLEIDSNPESATTDKIAALEQECHSVILELKAKFKQA